MIVQTETAKKFIAVTYSLSAVGCVSCALTVLLILALRAYKVCVHRLTLYLAVVSLFFAVSLALEVIPVDTGKPGDSAVTLRNGSAWKDACSAFGFVSQFTALSTNFLILWICSYVFLLAFFQFQMKGIKYELCGITMTFVFPVLLSWEPFIRDMYGLTDTWCYIKSSTNDTSYILLYKIGLLDVPEVLLCLVSLLLMTAVIVLFCWRFRTHGDYLQRQHRKALNEVLPLLTYPTLFCFACSVEVVHNIVLTFTSHVEEGRGSYIHEMIVIALFQALTISLPLSFLLHPHIRSQVCRRTKKPAVGGTEQLQTHSSTTCTAGPRSNTCFIVPSGSEYTETDPLIITQRISTDNQP